MSNPVKFYLFRVNKTNTKKRCEMRSKLRIKTPEGRTAHFVEDSQSIFKVKSVNARTVC